MNELEPGKPSIHHGNTLTPHQFARQFQPILRLCLPYRQARGLTDGKIHIKPNSYSTTLDVVTFTASSGHTKDLLTKVNRDADGVECWAAHMDHIYRKLQKEVGLKIEKAKAQYVP